MPVIEPVRIPGLRDLARALRAIDTDLPKALRLAGNRAAEVVVVEAKTGVPRKTGRAAASIKTRSTRTESRVVSGGGRAPWMPWLDYGGRVGRGDTASRPFIPDGRYVYPAYRRKRPEFERIMLAELAAIITAAGLEVD